MAGEDVGLYAFVLESLSAGHNYVLAPEDDAATFEITARPLTLTAMTTSITYGDTPGDLTSLVAAHSTSLRDGDALSGSLTMPTAAAGTHVFGAGDAHIARGETNVTSNYAITYDTYDVTQRPATIIPTADQSKTYGEADATLEYGTEGILEGDSISGVLARVDGEDVGSYSFALGTLTNPNYALTITGEPATYVITPRSITLGASTPSKEYGDIDPSLAPVLLGDTTLRSGDALTGELAHDGVNANPAYALTIGSVKVMREAVEVTSNYDITFGTFAIEPKPVSFAITNSDFVIGTEAGMAHVFRGDGASQIRGLEVASDPSNMDSFRFTYRRTHDQNNNPVPSGQQTVQNINLLGSYIVTVIANDPNYVGQTPLNVWVTDVSEIVFLDDTADDVVLGMTTSMSVELRNANGDPRPAGPAGLTIDLSVDGADVNLRNVSDNQTITSLTIAAGASSATALIRPLAAGAVTVTATPVTNPASGFSPVDLRFTAVEPVLTASNDGPYEVVAGGSVQIAISELLENDSWTGATAWGFDGVVSTSGVTAVVAGNNLVVSANPSAGNTTGSVTYQIRSAGDFGQTTTATVTVSVKLPPVEALLFTDRNELIEFIGKPYVLPTFQTVFNSWPRFENNSYYSVPNGSGGAWTGNLAHWIYDTENQRIEYGNNNEQHIGIVSDEEFEYFDFEATLQSSNTDDDSIGLVIAFTRVNGVNKALIAHRTQGGNAPVGGWGISYLNGSTLTVLQDVSIGGKSGGWSGNSSRVRIQRTGDIIRTSTTPWNTLTNFQGEFAIDLEANTINGQGISQDLSVFKGKQRYGYYVRSQANTTYVDIEFKGGVALDTAILLTNYDSFGNYWTGSEVYKFDVDGWGGEPVIGATIQTALGYPRTVTSVATESSVNGDSFEVFVNRVEAHNLPD